MCGKALRCRYVFRYRTSAPRSSGDGRYVGQCGLQSLGLKAALEDGVTYDGPGLEVARACERRLIHFRAEPTGRHLATRSAAPVPLTLLHLGKWILRIRLAHHPATAGAPGSAGAPGDRGCGVFGDGGGFADVAGDGGRFADVPGHGGRFADVAGDGGRFADVPRDGGRSADVPRDGRRFADVPHRRGFSARNEEQADGSGGVADEFCRVLVEARGGAVPQRARQPRIAFRVGDPAGGLGQVRDLAQGLDGLAGGFETRDVRAWIGRPLQRIGQRIDAVGELHDPLAGVVERCPDPFDKPDLVGSEFSRDAAVFTQPGAAFVDLVLELLLLRIDPRADLLFFRIHVADDRYDGIRPRFGILDRGVPGIAGSLRGFLCGVSDAVAGLLEESTNIVEQSHRGLSFVPTLRGRSLL